MSMLSTRRSLLLSLPVGLAAAARMRGSTTPPAPYGALPSVRQIAWSGMEYYNFVHFTINTFTGKEWGDGDEPPSIFNPTDFDPDALVEILKASGSKGVILTCKHHDGFCLFDSKFTDYKATNTPAHRDLVREYVNAFRAQGPQRRVVARVERDGFFPQRALACQPPRVHYQRWTPGDVVVWDNRCLMHKANGDYPVGEVRYLYRLMLKGGRPA